MVFETRIYAPVVLQSKTRHGGYAGLRRLHPDSPGQDILGLDAEARMNRPAESKGNWRWRLKSAQLTSKVANKVARLAQTFGR